MLRPVSFAAVYLLAALNCVAGQHINGRVLEVNTDVPLAQALLIVRTMDSTLIAMAVTASDGAFVVSFPRHDSVRLNVERIGYAPTESRPLSIGDNDTLRLEIRLRPLPIQLGELNVAAQSAISHNLRGFLNRTRSGFGRYLGPSEISAIKATSAADLLMKAAPNRFQTYGARGGALLARRPPALELGYAPGERVAWLCTPLVYIDGVQIRETIPAEPLGANRRSAGLPEAVPVDWHVTAADIRAIEVYRIPAQAPPQFQTSSALMGDCAIVAIWTDWGFGLRPWRPR